jgi:hypothetical protein
LKKDRNEKKLKRIQKPRKEEDCDDGREKTINKNCLTHGTAQRPL